MSDQTSAFRRGDVVLVSFPYVTDPTQSKVRPAVVIQNDVGNRFSPNLIVASISSQLPKREYPTNLIVRVSAPEAAGTGLDRDSVLQAEIILTVPKASVVRRLGGLPAVTLQEFDRCLVVSLGLP